MTKERLEYLETRLGIDKKPVTAKFLSREWRIPTKEASELMLRFHDSHKANDAFKDLSVKYSVCGKQKCERKVETEKCERHADVLVNIIDHNDLNQTIEQLYANVISCQIYSMHLQPSVSLTNIIDACTPGESTFSDELMTKCGILRTATNGVVEHYEQQHEEEQPVRRAQTEPMKPQKQARVESKVEEEEKSRPVYVSRKASSNPAVISSSTKATPEVKKPVYVSRKRQKESNEGEENDSSFSKKAKTPSQTKKKKQEEERKELEKMLQDDFSDDDFGEVNHSDDGNISSKEPEYKYDDIDLAEPEVEKIDEERDLRSTIEDAKEEDINTGAFSDKEILASKTKSKSAEPAEPAETQPDVETYIDADGYVVRKVNRKAAKPVQTNTPAKPSYAIDTKSSKGKTSSNARKQSNLMSFFKKKE